MARFEGIQLMFAAEPVHLSGKFTNVDGLIPDDVWEYGYRWSHKDAHGVCHFCGSTRSDPYACDHCGAPTQAWWARLDEMIAEWKREHYA